jgi:transcriptional regulator with XRE-family HTH domain
MKNLREIRGDLSLDDVSKAVGLASSTLSRIERGEQFPQRSTMKKLANFYSLSEADIFQLSSIAVDSFKSNQAA